MLRDIFLVFLVVTFAPQAIAQAQWRLPDAALLTRWGKAIAPIDRAPHAEYPRPQLQRESWHNLNGTWDYAIRPRDVSWSDDDDRDGIILVPFPVESALSGVMKRVGAENRLWYRTRFAVPDSSDDSRLLLHFGAVDWECRVWLNGTFVGEHRGGYDPFTFDITDHLRDGAQSLVVGVWDPTDRGTQPRGKQVEKPRGIWYTPVTGIWQTVWIEPVPKTRIADLSLTPYFAERVVRVEVGTVGPTDGVRVHYRVRAGDAVVTEVGAPLRESPRLSLESLVRAWSPDDPFLYDLEIELRDAERNVIDRVTSYFGLRDIAVRADPDGHRRLFLNGAPLFQHGPLDQGWWPDGLYTAPSDDALRYDLEVTKRLGFNMVRKHVKVEPARWYHHCDELGLLVWQDMPNGDRGANWTADESAEGREIRRTAQSALQFERELGAVVEALRNHPSIVVWVPFNEAWGQFDTVRICEQLKRLDPTRLVNCASGGNDYPIGDIFDVHRYPGPFLPEHRDGRVTVLGEFGGLGLPLAGHTWRAEKNWGYRSFEDRASLQQAFDTLITNLRPLIAEGLAASVYTQTTDVEIEVNGLMTYDRDVLKLDAARVAELHRKLYLPPPRLIPILATSEREGQTWRMTTVAPPDGWERSDFDDASWHEAPGGFGTPGTPGAVVGTAWNTPDIWVRRTFEWRDEPPSNPHLRIHHDEDAEVYLNGELVRRASDFTTSYVLLPMEGRRALRQGRNVLAVHCHQTGGGQFLDVGIVDVVERSSSR